MRSKKKAYYVDPSLTKKVAKAKADGSFYKGVPIQTYSRRSTIIIDFVGGFFKVHGGQKFTVVSVTEEMIGHKLGEFSPTRTFHGHTDKKVDKK